MSPRVSEYPSGSGLVGSLAEVCLDIHDENNGIITRVVNKERHSTSSIAKGFVMVS